MASPSAEPAADRAAPPAVETDPGPPGTPAPTAATARKRPRLVVPLLVLMAVLTGVGAVAGLKPDLVHQLLMHQPVAEAIEPLLATETHWLAELTPSWETAGAEPVLRLDALLDPSAPRAGEAVFVVGFIASDGAVVEERHLAVGLEDAEGHLILQLENVPEEAVTLQAALEPLP